LGVTFSTEDKKITMSPRVFEMPEKIHIVINNLEKGDRIQEFIDHFSVRSALLENGRASLSNKKNCANCGAWLEFYYNYDNSDVGKYLLPIDREYIHFPEINVAVNAIEQDLPPGCMVETGKHGYVAGFLGGRETRLTLEGTDCPSEIRVEKPSYYKGVYNPIGITASDRHLDYPPKYIDKPYWIRLFLESIVKQFLNLIMKN
jgi:hypothetical protein